MVYRFLIALAIGGLVGLEREMYQQKTRRGFAGIRTYLVVAFLGAVSSYLVQVEEWRVMGYLVLFGIIVLLVASYTVSAMKGYMGLTTEMSVVLVFLLAMMSTVPKYQQISVIFAVVLTLMLSLKEHLHRFAKTTKEPEWKDTLTFVFMAFVILPLLPNENFSVLGIDGAFNPYRTWLMVVFVSGVSFVGYFLTKVIGGSYGIGIAGVLGGMVSSTVVTESMAVDSKKNESLTSSYAVGAIAASVVMGIRVLFEVWVIDEQMITIMVLPLLSMSAVGALMALRWIEPGEWKKRAVNIKLGSPLTVRPALMFGLLYSLVFFLSKYMMQHGVSEYGLVALGLVSGLVDVDAITLTLTSLYAQAEVSMVLAWTAIIGAVIVNTFFKMVISKVFGSKMYFTRVGGSLFVVALMGIISLLFYLLFVVS